MVRKFLDRLAETRTWIVTHPTQRRAVEMLVLCGITALLLFPTLGSPRAIVFDESYMIPRGQKYIHGVFFRDSHPPLGRLFIGLGQYLVNPEAPSNEYLNTDQITGNWPDNLDMTGYRLFPAIFGSFNPVLIFLIVLLVTASEGFALFCGLAAAFDLALLIQSHFALSDSILLTFILLLLLCGCWLLSRKGKPQRADYVMWVLTGLAAGAAFMVKFTGLFACLLIPIYIYKLFANGYKRQIMPFLLATGLAFLFVFVTVWEIHFSLLTNFTPNSGFRLTPEHEQMLEGTLHPNPVLGFWYEVSDSYAYMIKYHEDVPALDLEKPTEIGSPWYNWPFGGRAMAYRWATSVEQVQFIYLMGNPVTWLLSLLGVIGATAIVVTQLVFRFMPAASRRFWIFSFALLYWAYMFTVALIPRVLYLYHYLPPMSVGLILFGVIFAEMTTISLKTKRIFMGVATVLLILSFVVYSPFLYFLPLTQQQFQQRVIWPGWDLRCVHCPTPKPSPTPIPTPSPFLHP